MRRSHVLIVGSAIVMAGCNLSSDLSTTQRLGFVNITQVGEGDSAKLNIVGQFFQSSPSIQPTIPNTAAVGDTCNVFDYTGPPDNPNPVKVDNLNAGDTITVTTDKAVGKLVPVVNLAGSVDYRLVGGMVPFTPGSQVTINIPGDTGGFPAHSAKVNSFVTPTFAAIERHPEEDLDLHWSSGGAPLGAMQLDFLYSNTDSPAPNKEMICRLRDDGNYTIARFIVGGEWEKSPDGAQSVSGIRWNTTLQQNQDVLLDVIVQVPLPSLPLTAPDTTPAALRAPATH
ncbi:MAG TPA: hypothetical protein VFK04_19180 [Gemmatimonadaceae bacterium]|nr:hypothetical protein [Gemmatimonadaceae bacterium]